MKILPKNVLMLFIAGMGFAPIHAIELPETFIRTLASFIASKAALQEMPESTKEPARLIPFNGAQHANQALKIFNAAFVSHDHLPAVKLLKDENDADIDGLKALVWVERNTVAGILIYEDSRYCRYIHYLAVSSDKRSQGIGSAMLERFEQMSADEQQDLIMLAPAERAIVFYCMNGYRCRCTSCDCSTMTKKLNQGLPPFL